MENLPQLHIQGSKQDIAQ